MIISELIKDGILADIDNIHRQTIDRATEKKEKKKLPSGLVISERSSIYELGSTKKKSI